MAALVVQAALLAVPQSAHAQTTPESRWFLEPYRLEADGQPIDTGSDEDGWNNSSGHAAPFFGDIFGDGQRHLVVGTFTGEFRLIPVTGGSWQYPKFSLHSNVPAWLNADGQRASVYNACCVAPQPQIVDIDGDLIPDITSGSYSPFIYWFKGLGDGKFATRQVLTDRRGYPLVPRIAEITKFVRNTGTSIAWTQGFGSFNQKRILPDMVIGSAEGAVFIAYNDGQYPHKGLTPVPTQPTFKRPVEILIDGKKAIPDTHAAPAVMDFDDDGLKDIVVGSESGAVYWLRNSGSAEDPRFVSCEQIMGPGKSYQVLKPGESPRRGVRSYVQPHVFQGSKPLLLVGDWSNTSTLRKDLTAAEKKHAERIQREMLELDRRFGIKSYGDQVPRHARDPSVSGEDGTGEAKDHPHRRMGELYWELDRYVTRKTHGFVWVFPRNQKRSSGE